MSSPRSIIFLSLTFFLLFTSFRWNIFGIDKAQLENNLTVDYHIIPTMEMYAAGPALQRNLSGLIDTDDGVNFHPYVMMMGLHRMMYSWISPHSAAGVDRAIPYLRSLIAALQALVFTAFIAIVVTEFGVLCAAIAAILLTLSNWLIIFGPDLYWFAVAFFIPFVLGWLLGDPARSIKQQRLLAILYTFFCTIKCLCGFDYITNVFAAIAVPLIYYGLLRNISLVKIATRILHYGALSVLAFLSAILLQFIQYSIVQKDIKGSIDFFLWEVHRRTLSNGEGISNHYDTAILTVLHRLHVPASYDATLEHILIPLRPLSRYLHYLTMGAFTIGPLAVPIGVVVAGILIAAWLQRKHLAQPANRTTAWMAATLTALVISHFWIVAASGHMTHTFFNAIVFYIPFLPMAYVAIGIGITSLYKRLRPRI